ncbi:lipoprotein [Brevibacillus agri]|uniref:Lipoprotein n=1 Tax=Brevibacillus agri TaxID=51101 RepID=A0A3M8ALV2_9BACL|nr:MULTISPECIES: hypothetical protein [Brevibacillus]ELK39971.1 lipoprotein [Brevibacillus agri BAB-2500]EJL41684.1 hypothetical protein PMI08_03651 [Brevibacillus sp. CF112]MBY0053696.1 hypothetical protein [Brevibacillus agri]MDN4095377.1 hypothetical protein [Brevibacillus agri]MED1824370.1 hypothetical protein [Brevibacillus agri]
MRSIFLHIILACLLLTAGCVNDNSFAGNNEQNLKIGVIGQPPVVNENIDFIETTLESLINASDTEFHALFIMPECLEEASKPQFARLYKSLKYPVFFIGSTKSYYPFIEESLTYSTAPSTSSGMFATGFINEDGQYKIFEYGLENDEKTEKNLKLMYTNIFKTISNEFISKKTN